MKPFIKIIQHYIFLAFFLTLIIFSCEENDDEPAAPTSNPVTQGDPTRVTESLSFKNAVMHSGNIPTNTSEIDIRLDRDTIGLTEGLPPFVGIIKPSGTVLQIAWAQVEGSDTYFEAEFEETENDTLVFLNFEFDGTGWDYPVSFNLTIAPVDDSGAPAKIITVPVIVTAPEENSGGCDIDEFLDGKNAMTYKWKITVDENLDNQVTGYSLDIYGFQGGMYTPGMEKAYAQEVSGCCTSSGGYYGNCIGFPSHALVTGVTKSVIGGAELTFFRDGTVIGYLTNQLTQNVDPKNFDFCNGVPAYNITSVDNVYEGTYTFNSSNCTIMIDNFVGLTDPVIGASGAYIGEWPRPIYSRFGSGVTYSKYTDFGIKEVETSVETRDTTRIKFYDRY